MNFFEHQERAQRKTGRLVFLFTLCVVATIAAVNGIIYGSIYFAMLDNPELIFLLSFPIWLYVTGFFLTVMCLGTLVKMIRLSGGGLSVAKMVEARPLAEGAQNIKEQQFINVVEEMGIASGTAVPHLFVMEDPSINAFVAGTKPEDTVMVVTTGALQAFNRDEMQAVVGHEFSHILNGDMKISLRLMGVLGGILVIGTVGRMLMHVRGRSYSRGGRQNGSFFLIGLGIMIVGGIGLFFGRLIKASVSRQRELLADSCSVQFTRNPHGLVSAFRVMQSHENGTYLRTKHSEDISHMCFGQAQLMAFRNLMATHPSLEKRIQAIDPSDMYGILPRTDEKKQQEQPKKEDPTQGFMTMMAATVMATSAQDIENSIAAPNQDHITYAVALAASIPQVLRESARSPQSVEAYLYALFMHGQPEENVEVLLSTLKEANRAQVSELRQALQSVELPSMLPLFELALPHFSRLKTLEQRYIIETLEGWLEQKPTTAFHFALMTMLRHQLPKAKKEKAITKLEVVLKQLTYVYAVLLHHSGQDVEAQKAVFKQEMAKVTSRNIAFPNLDTANYRLLNKALETLSRVTPIGKEVIIKGCIQCVVADGQVVVKEAELLRAICEALDCPIPPILGKPVAT